MFIFSRKNNEQDEVMLARRLFFGRIAFGAALSVALPEIVQAEKKTEIHQGIAPSAKTAVRLPNRKVLKPVNTRLKTSSSSNKKHRHASSVERLQVADVEHASLQSNRVHHVYSANKNTLKTESQTHKNQASSIIQAKSKVLGSPHSPDSLPVADQGALISHRSLAFQNPHTGDKLNLTYFEQGRYLDDALGEINYLLRDHRTGDVHPIDTELLDQLHDLKQMLGLKQPFDIICGYRSPLTNAKLHAENAGVANNSFHIHGRAIDIRIERFDLRRIQNAALAMHRGGVGYYPGSNFIHLDTGTFRNWTL